MQFFAMYFGTLAAAATCDAVLKLQLPPVGNRKLAVLRSSLISTIATLEGQRISFYRRCLLVLLLLFLFQLAALAFFDPITASVVWSLMYANPVVSIGLAVTTYVISLWSFSQSNFFIKLANRLTSPIGMVYLYISDLILSSIIFAFGVAFYFTIINYLIPYRDYFDTSIAIHNDCGSDGKCQLLGLNFFDGEEFRSIIWAIPIENDPQESARKIALDDYVESVLLVPADSEDLSESEREFLKSGDQKDVKYFLRLRLNSSRYNVTNWDAFTFQLKKQIDEMWLHFRYGFQYYSFQQFKYGKYDLREFNMIADYEEFLQSDALVSFIPDASLRSRYVQIMMSGEVPDSATLDAPVSLDMSALSTLIRFQWAKWLMLRELGTTDFFLQYEDVDYKKFMEDPRRHLIYGPRGIRPYFVPVTTFWIASISFSSLFLAFLFARAALAVLGRFGEQIATRVEQFPLTAFVVCVFPLGSLYWSL
ncbi:MAG: hypothetical protein IOD05_03720 [Rhodobacter sp.]|nr:hypothetical protein [Rhodobacter sp.]MCA3502372.1 hypothetical protein [Rhodobacter sp.]